MIETIKDGFPFTSICYPFNKYDAICVRPGSRDLEDYIDYINRNNIERAYIIWNSLDFIVRCPSLKYLRILPSAAANDNFDFSPLYEMPEICSLNCVTTYGETGQYTGVIDYSQINGLRDLSLEFNRGALNVASITGLKSLSVGGFSSKTKDLNGLFCSKELDSLRLTQCRIHSLNGIEMSNNLQCLYLYDNRSLHDISALWHARDTLKALRIENCSKITDFSVLQEMHCLELLELCGNNTLPDINFLNQMSNLKTFCFDMKVECGNLSPCLRLHYAACLKDKRHYNLKDSDLPKNKPFIHGNEKIEVWRRWE